MMRFAVPMLVALLIGAAPAARAEAEVLCTLVVDARDGAVVVETGNCDGRVTPASTFKVALAAMAFDAGLLRDAHAPVMEWRPGDPDWGGANWTRDTDPTDWIRYSVVWYSQRLTRAMGAEALTRHARAFAYGNADFGGDPGRDNGLERAWLASSLRISPREQVTFLRALARGTLPVAAEAMVRARGLVEHRAVGDWEVHGKTGAAAPRRADRSFDRAHAWGWYVGWAERDGRLLVFARLTQARERTGGSPGILTRDAFLAEWPGLAAGPLR